MKQDVLRKLQNIGGLDKDLANQIIDLASPAYYPPRTILARPGIGCRKAAFIYSGIIKYYALGKKGEEIVFNFKEAPNFVTYSLSGFFLNGQEQSYCETISEVSCFEIQSEELLDLAQTNPILYQFFLKVTAQVYQERQLKEFSILEKSSMERYLDFSQSYSKSLDIIPLKSIASFLNIQPGSLSRLRKILNS